MNFDNSAEKYMRNSKVFFCLISKVMMNEYVVFLHKKIFVQIILQDIENATCKMFLWKLETQLWNLPKTFRQKPERF